MFSHPCLCYLLSRQSLQCAFPRHKSSNACSSVQDLPRPSIKMPEHLISWLTDCALASRFSPNCNDRCSPVRRSYVKFGLASIEILCLTAPRPVSMLQSRQARTNRPVTTKEVPQPRRDLTELPSDASICRCRGRNLRWLGSRRQEEARQIEYDQASGNHRQKALSCELDQRHALAG